MCTVGVAVYCPSCGSKMVDGSRFCSACGTAIEPGSHAAQLPNSTTVAVTEDLASTELPTGGAVSVDGNSGSSRGSLSRFWLGAAIFFAAVVVAAVLGLTPRSSSDSDIRGVVDRSIDAYKAGDVEALYQLLSPDAQQACPESEFLALYRLDRQTIEELSIDSANISYEDIEIVVAGDIGYVSYIATYGGLELIAVPPTDPDLYVRINQNWYDDVDHWLTDMCFSAQAATDVDLEEVEGSINGIGTSPTGRFADVASVLASGRFFIEQGADATDSIVSDAVADSRLSGGALFVVVLATEPPGGTTTFAEAVLDDLPSGTGTVLVVGPETVGWASSGDIWTKDQLVTALDRSLGGTTSDDVVTLFAGSLAELASNS